MKGIIKDFKHEVSLILSENEFEIFVSLMNEWDENFKGTSSLNNGGIWEKKNNLEGFSRGRVVD